MSAAAGATGAVTLIKTPPNPTNRASGVVTAPIRLNCQASFGFESITLRKWRDSGLKPGSRGGKGIMERYSSSTAILRKKKKYQLTGVVVECAAEGIERRGRMVMGIEGTGVVITKRLKVAALVAVGMCLCNADRVVMSVAVVPMASKLGWSNSFLGVVQSSFLWGYIISSVVGGALVDKYGGKRVMGWGVALWSLATLVTPWAANHSTISLLAIRAFFGLAQGVAMPSMNTLLSRWFPMDERASAVGITMAGFQLGNLVGLLVAPIIISLVGVSGPFILFSSLGLLWLTSWAQGVTDDPKDSPFITNSELQLIGKHHWYNNKTTKTVASATTTCINNINGGDNTSSSSSSTPVNVLLSKPASWAIITANFTNNWGYFVLLTWMPVYFNTVLNVNLKQAAWFSAVPWGVMAISGYVAGASSDYMIRMGYSLTLVRKIMQSIGFIGPGVSLLCLNYTNTPSVASVILTLALSLSSFSQAGFLLNVQDIAPNSAGLLHGLANSVGTLAAIISTIGTGYFVQWLGSFQAFMTITALLYFVSTIFYNLYATGEQLF